MSLPATSGCGGLSCGHHLAADSVSVRVIACIGKRRQPRTLATRAFQLTKLRVHSCFRLSTPLAAFVAHQCLAWRSACTMPALNDPETGLEAAETALHGPGPRALVAAVIDNRAGEVGLAVLDADGGALLVTQLVETTRSFAQTL